MERWCKDEILHFLCTFSLNLNLVDLPCVHVHNFWSSRACCSALTLCSRCLTMGKDSGENLCYRSLYPGASTVSRAVTQRIGQGTCLSVQYVFFTFSDEESLQSRTRNVILAMELSSLKIQINGNNRTYYLSKP